MSRPIRVLEVIGGANRGGAETWLLEALRNLDRERLDVHLLVHYAAPGAYDAEIRAMGFPIHKCVGHRRPWHYIRGLRRLLDGSGPFDVVHSHVNLFSGLVMRVAQRAGVPVRVAHGHTAKPPPADMPAGRALYEGTMRRWVQRHATLGFGVSEGAAETLFGRAWQCDRRWEVLHCGIPLDGFRASVDRSTVRAELGLSPTDLVIGHIGRFVAAKNHAFLLQTIAELAGLEPSTRLVLVGDGPLRPHIEDLSERLGLGNRVVFLGAREDIPRLLMGAVDVFLFPSLYEGLPLACLEAQAAGVPVVMSDTITREVEVVKELVTRMPLTCPPVAWAEVCLAAGRLRRAGSPGCWLARLEGGTHDVRVSARTLERKLLAACEASRPA
ncbi:MAG TPA: glycosyltransferase [Armatimonadota bacterium]|jgi:glycosyltransferase involved in cell wall biosynthesis